MKVQQALICAGGLGTRLGLGTKSFIIYRGRLILEYLLVSCIKAGIKNIVVVTIPRKYEKYLSQEKLKKFRNLKKKYPNIIFARDTGYRGFRKVPNYARRYLDVSKPFYLLCGHSPQISAFLRKISNYYKPGIITTSGYKYRYDTILSTGTTRGNFLITINNSEYKKPKAYNCSKRNEFVQHFPYVLDYEFYDNYIKKDNYKERAEFYLKKILGAGGSVQIFKNPVEISEIDFKRDFGKLKRSIDFVIQKDKIW